MPDEEPKPNTEPQTTEPQEPTDEPGSVDNNAVRNSALFQSLAKRMKAQDDALAARDQADRDAKALAERKELEAKGEYTTLLERREAEHTSAIDALKAQMLATELKAQLIGAGMKDPLTLTGATAGFSGAIEDIAPYVEQLKEGNAHHFGAPTEGQGGLAAPAHGSPGARSTNKSLEERLAEGDEAAQREAWKKLGLD